MKTGKLFAFVVTLFLFHVVFWGMAEMNLTGTWEGETYVQGGPVLMLTLVLEHKDSAITGSLTDDAGYIDSEISEAKLENGALTFSAFAQAPEGEVSLAFELTLEGDKMEGEWESDNGVYFGSWSPVRKSAESLSRE